MEAELDDAQIIQALDERQCCILGAASGTGGYANPQRTNEIGRKLGLDRAKVLAIICTWDLGCPLEAMSLAREWGLVPRIREFLQGEP